MLEPEIPTNETERVTELARLNLLDSEPEERFDRITRIAASIFNVPIALVSLVDANRQWFKSRVGLDACETDRNISFCGHAILEKSVFYVPDATADSRFADNPLVVGGPRIRMYAGAPITTDSGFRIGTLCIIDTKPRKLSSGQQLLLQELADLVQDQLLSVSTNERKQLVEDHETQLSAIIDTTIDGILTINSQGVIELANPSTEKFFGCKVESISGKHIDSFIPELHQWLSNHETLELKSHSREIEITNAKGEFLHLELSISKMTVQGNSKFACIMRDISSQIQAQEERARFKAIIETSDDAIISKTLDSVITSWNQGAAKMFGYASEEIVGKSILMLYPPMLVNEEKSIIEQITAGGRVEHFETVRQRKDGTMFPISVTCSPVFDNKGRVVAISNIARDITERKLAEHSLLLHKTSLENEVEQRGQDLAVFGHIISTTREQMTFLDNNFVFRAANRSFLTAVGKSQKEVIGHHIKDILGSRLFNESLEPFLSSCLRGDRLQTEIWDDIPGMESHCYEMLFDPHKDSTGRVVGIVVSGHDITESKRNVEYLKAANERANVANEAKSQFLANMSHELRTPLTAIINYVELLIVKSSSAADSPSSDILNKIHSAGKQLLTIITDIVDYTDLMDGNSNLDLEEIEVMDLIQEISGAALPVMQENKNVLHVECQENIGEIRSDSKKLAELLSQLLRNAAKFTEAGEVHLKVERSSNSQSDQLEFTVSDTGVGIEPEHIDSIFQPFVQGDNSSTRAFGGIGLGLSLARKYGELLGGDIVVEAKPGQGSDFRFILPEKHHESGLEAR